MFVWRRLKCSVARTSDRSVQAHLIPFTNHLLHGLFKWVFLAGCFTDRLKLLQVWLKVHLNHLGKCCVLLRTETVPEPFMSAFALTDKHAVWRMIKQQLTQQLIGSPDQASSSRSRLPQSSSPSDDHASQDYTEQPPMEGAPWNHRLFSLPTMRTATNKRMRTFKR